MSGKKKEKGVVLSQKMIAPDIYDMWISTSLAMEALPGQFVGVYPHNESKLLPRMTRKMRFGLCTGLQERGLKNLHHGSRDRKCFFWGFWETDFR